MRFSKILLAALSILCVAVLSSCGIAKLKPLMSEVNLNYENPENLYRYSGMTYGLNFAISAPGAQTSVVDYSELAEFMKKADYNIPANPSVETYAQIGFREYASASGFMVGMDSRNDRVLRVNITKFVLHDSRHSPRIEVNLNYTLATPSNEILISQTPVSVRYDVTKGENLTKAFNTAFVRALSRINWQAIAGKLTVSRDATQTPLQQVRGNGDTALENTIIRWFIESSPQGCDVSWRVVSSTPEVHNTNSTYMGTTPYEATESFDVRGLTLENSGNVQVEVTCEKPGYLTQRRRFNLRQAIDQREISAKFNMVKDE